MGLWLGLRPLQGYRHLQTARCSFDVFAANVMGYFLHSALFQNLAQDTLAILLAKRKVFKDVLHFCKG